MRFCSLGRVARGLPVVLPAGGPLAIGMHIPGSSGIEDDGWDGMDARETCCVYDGLVSEQKERTGGTCMRPDVCA